MNNYTTHYDLILPELDDYVHLDDLCYNFNEIDEQMYTNASAIAAHDGQIQTNYENIGDLQTGLSALERVVGDQNDGLVKDVADLQSDVADLKAKKKYLHTVCLKYNFSDTAFIIEVVSNSSTELNDYMPVISGDKYMCKSSEPDYIGCMWNGTDTFSVCTFDLTQTSGVKWQVFGVVQPDVQTVIQIKEI